MSMILTTAITTEDLERMIRLAATELAALPATVVVPTARPQAIGIVHLGLGAFHRAHQVELTDDALRQSGAAGAPWGICGVSLKTEGARDKLVAQDGLYTLVYRSPRGTQRRILGPSWR